jgi:asparagine synthase (glutamine-hydrolysing)
MCGIAGFLSFSNLANFEVQRIAEKMNTAISHRGPNESGYWRDDESQVFLVHRRLSIIDLTPSGSQPMVSLCGRFVIVFNGEIYNHLEIRKKLHLDYDYSIWRGTSDTETLLGGFSTMGLEKTLSESNGMFAFAVWDKLERELILGRDRMGEKPLYYGWQGSGSNSTFMFASELKALKQHPVFENQINRDAISLYMRYNCIPTPYSIYKGIFKLPPGCLIRVSNRNKQLNPEPYWSLSEVAKNGISNPFIGSESEAIDELESLLFSAIGNQMMSDVPLGAFLSGGIDSSLIVALMQAQSEARVKTFTIGFSDDNYNEANYAKKVAEHLGTSHIELYVTPNQALEIIPKLPDIYCEPFSDSSQIPTYLVSQLAQKNVTVALSGDAGDEIFAGYNRYIYTKTYWEKLNNTPIPLRSFLSNILLKISPDKLDRMFTPMFQVLPSRLQLSNVSEKIHKSASLINSESFDDLYLKLTSHWDPGSVVIDGLELKTFLESKKLEFDGLNYLQRMMLSDSISYLPDDILTKVDRAAMAVSLETRVPFLDHRVIEFAWKLPDQFKIRDGKGKWILKQILSKYIPNNLIERPKMGFGVPIDSWLRGPLLDWAENLLDQGRLKREGYFKTDVIHKKWNEHKSGSRNWQHHLWDVLMFQAWLESNQQN